MKCSQQFLLLAVALIALLFSACASPRAVSNGRQGFWSMMEEDSGHSPRSKKSKKKVEEASEQGGAVAKPFVTPELGKVAAQLALHWPLSQHEVTSLYGKRKRDFHEGVDFRARPGTPVFAAQTGKVIYAGNRIRGYGKMLVVKHDRGIATVYAHNSKLLVKTGQQLKQGQKIAISGNTGRSTGPHLHFEVRMGPEAVDPMAFLASGNGGLTKNRTWNNSLGKNRYIHLTMRPPATAETGRTRD